MDQLKGRQFYFHVSMRTSVRQMPQAGIPTHTVTENWRDRMHHWVLHWKVLALRDAGFSLPVLHWASLPACCCLPTLWLWRGLWVAGPIISPWISLRRVSARLNGAGYSRPALWPTYNTQLWLSGQQYSHIQGKKNNILTYIFEIPHWSIWEYC